MGWRTGGGALAGETQMGGRFGGAVATGTSANVSKGGRNG